ncbi:hypothetical protein WEI85_46365 [Actinomycetes bacterium KLBMP 9797]
MSVRRVVASSAAAIVGTLGFLGPSAAYAADVSIQSSQCTTLYTKDAAPTGGRLSVCKSWFGSGPYYGRVEGTVEDLDADGRSVYVRGWFDGYGS